MGCQRSPLRPTELYVKTPLDRCLSCNDDVTCSRVNLVLAPAPIGKHTTLSACTSHHQRCTCRVTQGKHEDSLRFCEQSLAIRRKAFGSKHEDVAESLYLRSALLLRACQVRQRLQYMSCTNASTVLRNRMSNVTSRRRLVILTDSVKACFTQGSSPVACVVSLSACDLRT